MRNVSSWLRQAGMNFANSIQRFMMGRYGHDRLNVALLIVGVILTVISMFARSKLVVLVTTMLSYVMLILALYRCFSRSTYKRYNENRRFLLMMDRLKDRNNRYYACPKCRQTVRVPRGKGKITVTCRSCGASFQEKS